MIQNILINQFIFLYFYEVIYISKIPPSPSYIFRCIIQYLKHIFQITLTIFTKSLQKLLLLFSNLNILQTNILQSTIHNSNFQIALFIHNMHRIRLSQTWKFPTVIFQMRTIKKLRLLIRVKNGGF